MNFGLCWFDIELGMPEGPRPGALCHELENVLWGEVTSGTWRVRVIGRGLHGALG